MVVITHERLTAALIEELAPLLQAHYEELTFNKERIKLAPRWDRYLVLQSIDMLQVYVAREAGRIVGYSFFFVDYHLHYEATLFAMNDVFFVIPERRSGPTALRLVRFAEQQLMANGVDKVAYHYKAANNFGRILQRLGYAYEEEVAAKLL